MAARIQVDKCDCSRDNCPGCFYPCESCGSTKCLSCRSGRAWDYDLIEYIPIQTNTKSNDKDKDEEEVNGNAFINEVIQHNGYKEDANKTDDNIIIIEDENIDIENNENINIENNENLSNEINNVNVNLELGDCEKDPNEVNEINVNPIEKFECIGDVDNSMQSNYVKNKDVLYDEKSEYVKENVLQTTDVRSQKIADGPETENIEDTEMKDVKNMDINVDVDKEVNSEYVEENVSQITDVGLFDDGIETENIEDTEEKDFKNTLDKIINSLVTTIVKDSSTNENTDKKIVDDTEEETIEEIDVVFTDVTKNNTVENALENSAKNIIGDKDNLSIENKRAGEITVQKTFIKNAERNCSEDIGVVITEKDTIKHFVENTIQSKTNIENTKKIVVESIEDEIVESTDKKSNESIEKETVGNKDKNTEEKIVVNTHEEGEKNTDKCLNTDSHVLEQTIQNIEQEVIEITKDAMLTNPESPYLQSMETVIHKNPEESTEEEIIKCLEGSIFGVIEKEIDEELNK